MWRRCIVLLVMLLASAAILAAKTIDYDALERQWEGGDMDDELLSDDELEYRRKGTLDKSEMVFVALKEDIVDRLVPEEPPNSAVSELCATWKHMLMHGGLTVNFYELEQYKVLAGMQHGGRVKDLRDFFLEQPEVKDVTWDQTTYYPPSASASSSSSKKKKKTIKKKPAKKKSHPAKVEL
ncbi:Aste57867_15245 [Aphanomyces stellatus]|uniref:Aste57867_15245 protein n=1 Tax=Aphanomyces stellatus TaxID=120398 RepID=A0A485L3N8_9STRA|nr:hypothetical protein As57867_015189 [Aphanomyces stellatus]VFT92054.1 Aste57867_15245 [Aphanomyces stellatus]